MAPPTNYFKEEEATGGYAAVNGKAAGTTSRTINVAEIQRHGGKKILLPSGPPPMEYDAAIEIIQRQKKLETEIIQIDEVVGGFPYDGALAMIAAMEEEFGYATAEKIWTIFGSKPPQVVSVEVGFGKTKHVPWGNFNIPAIQAQVSFQSREVNDRLVFAFTCTCMRKYEEQVRNLAQRARVILSERSIYRGKAVKIRFNDDDGDPLEIPEVRFLDLSRVRPEELVFSEDVQAGIDTNILTPIRHMAEAAELGVPFKRGVLLAGGFGVGKTELGYVVAKEAVDQGVTYILNERADEFAETVQFAKLYEPSVVCSEDVDRVMGGDRDAKMDVISTTMDGIEAKRSSVMAILTTNQPRAINQLLIRPGRIDVVLYVKEPDASAVERLIRLYGRGFVHAEEPLGEVGKALDGQKPAVIREVVERSKLGALKLLAASNGGKLPEDWKKTLTITEQALIEGAQTMADQLELLAEKREPEPNAFQQLGSALGKAISDGLKKHIYEIDPEDLANEEVPPKRLKSIGRQIAKRLVSAAAGQEVEIE